MKHEPWKKPSVAVVAAVLLSALAATIFVVAAKPLVEGYHRWRFGVAHDYFENGPKQVHPNGLVSIDITEIEPVHDYHLSRLVALGTITRLDFTFKNILNNSKQRSTLARKLLAGNCPPSLNWQSAAPRDTSPMTLVVWCEHTDADMWRSFLQTEDNSATTVP